MSGDAEKKWFYMKDKTRLGPVSASQMPEDADMLVWREGMTNWKKRGELDELKNVKGVPKVKEYYYQNASGSQDGPVDKWELLNLHTGEQVFAETLAWTEGQDGWKPISEIPDISALGIKSKKKTPEPAAAPAASTASSTASAAASTTASAGPKEWYYSDNYRARQGPVSVGEMRKLVADAALHKASLVWKEGMSEWSACETIPALLALFTEAAAAASSQKSNGDSSDSNAMTDDKPAPLDATTSTEAKADKEEEEALTGGSDGENANKKKRKARNNQKGKRKKWKQVKKHANIYVSGLPTDITVEQMQEHFSKCGIIKQDHEGKPRIKLYEDKEGKKKGDGLVSFLKEESVDLAIQICDESIIREGFTIKVQKAQFKMKGDKYIPKEEDKSDGGSVQKATEKRLRRMRDQSKELSWDDEPDDRNGLRIIILKPMFEPQEALETGDPDTWYEELEREVGIECQKVGGPIEKLTVFKGSPEGAIAIKYKQPSGAAKCIEVMNERYFGGRLISCAYFDGTDYRVKETEEDEQKRLDEFGAWLEEE